MHGRPDADKMNMSRMLCRVLQWIAVCALAAGCLLAQNLDVNALQHKAEAGDAKAAYDLARVYFEGKLVKLDTEQGMTWLRRAAVEGYPGAEVTLGYFYQRGFEGKNSANIKADPHRAAEWYRKAARAAKTSPSDQSADNARANLAQMLQQGLISKQEADWRGTEGTSATRESKPAKAGPFSLAEVETGLTGGITCKRMSTLVSTYGVDFSLNATAKKRLTDDGADDTLLQTIASAKR